MKNKTPEATVGSIINYSQDNPEKRYSIIVYGDDEAIARPPRARKPRSRETVARYPGICENPDCREPFVAKRPFAKYCSDYCRDAKRNRERTQKVGSKSDFDPARLESFYHNEEKRREKRPRL